jgi:small-conductance mechanosensitive channel
MSHTSITPSFLRRFAAMAVLLAACLLASQTQAQAPGQGAAPAQPAGVAQPFDTAQVIVDGKALFPVRGIAAYPARERALEIRRKIIEVAQNEEFDVAGLSILEEADHTAIMAGEVRVLAILDVDAGLEGLERHLLAEVYREIIAQTITAFRAERSADRLLSNSLYAVLATAAVALLLWLTKRSFRWLVDWAERNMRRGVSKLASKSRHLVHAGQIWSLIASLLKVARLLVYLILTYFYLNLVLGLYPWTRPLARALLGLVLDPLKTLAVGFVAQLPNLVFLVVLWFLVGYILKLVRAFFVAVEQGRIDLESFEAEWAIPTFKIVRVAIIAFALVIAYPYIPGSDSLAFKGVSVFAGVLLSLGSSSFISNSIAGLTMTYRGAFRPGDRIKVGDTMGTVEAVKLMVTRVRTPKNESVIIPNSNILNTDVINYTQLAKTEGLMLYTTVGIGYDVPWRQVEAMLVEAAKRTDGLDQSREPFVLQTALGDYAVNYQLNVFTNDPDPMAEMYSNLHAHIQDVFNENGVQIMSPAYIADPAEPKVVPPENWFEPPATKPEAAD